MSDAILGAIGAGDLGRHFPSSDERWRGVAGGEILTQVVAIMAEAGYAIGNVDATIIAQAPRLAPHQKAMHENLPFLNNIHKATRAISLESALSGLPVPLHSGAARFYQESGLEIPGALLGG